MLNHIRSSLRVPRRGFTLIELMIVVSLLGIIGSMLTIILVRQQRFHRAVANVTDSRARMRDVATILPTDVRGISSAGGDILEVSDTSMHFRAFVGTSILCTFATGNGVNPAIIELPPKTLASGNVLTAWINPPSPNDVAFLYDDGTEDGNIDDQWVPFRITDTTSSTNSAWCPSNLSPAYTTAADDAARRYRITLDGAPNQAQVKRGAPIRFAREVRYSVYQGSDNNWYVGYQRCTPNTPLDDLPGDCGDREVLAGPVLPATNDTLSSGLFFVFYKKDGTRVTAASAADTIAYLTVGIRTTSESLLKATTRTGGEMTGGDSLRFVIGIRNRI